MRQRHGLFFGIAVLSCGTVVLQIALTRLYSALFGHHLAFLAISLSLFGVGLGGVLLYVFPRLASPSTLLARLSYLAGLASAGTLVALLFILHAKPIETFDAASLGRLAVLYLISSVPFVVVGIAVAAAIRHVARDMSRLYLIDLVGAAAGGLVAIAALRAGAPRACLVVGILDAIAAIAFYLAAPRPTAEPSDPDHERRAHGGVVATTALAAVVLLAGDLGAPWLKLPNLRWVPMDKVEFQAWNEMALITVDKPQAGMAKMRMDGSAETAILDPKTTPPLHPDEMAYVLHKDQGPVLVIGSGGGRDLRAALKYGQTDIYAAEINPIIVEGVMRGRYKAFSGDLYDKPEVHVTVADGRSYVRRAPIKFRSIVISLVDTWAAASVGALALTENSLYTVEAVRDYIEHLTPSGTLLINRWDNEFERLLALGVAGLRAAGADAPERHLYACGAARTTSLLVKRAPFTLEEIEQLRTHCKLNRFVEAFAPDQPKSELRRRIAAFADIDVAAPDPLTDLRAPTDDRPFFFYTIPPRRLLKVVTDLKGLQTDHQGLLTLIGLLVVSVVIAAVFILGPLGLKRRPAAALASAKPAPRLRPLFFFWCLGVGFVLVEVALVQHFVMFLGHPVYALSTVLVALLLWAGIGSLLTARVDASLAELSAGRRAQLLVAALSVYAAALGPLLENLVSLPFAARLALTLVMLAPLGVLMGSQAPLGVKLLAVRSPELIPWCWGLNGVASVVATASGALLALHLGFSALLLAGGASYLLAAVAVPRYPVGSQGEGAESL
jgi:SAM-dependent methyltransferase